MPRTFKREDLLRFGEGDQVVFSLQGQRMRAEIDAVAFNDNLDMLIVIFKQVWKGQLTQPNTGERWTLCSQAESKELPGMAEDRLSLRVVEEDSNYLVVTGGSTSDQIMFGKPGSIGHISLKALNCPTCQGSSCMFSGESLWTPCPHSTSPVARIA